MNRYGSVNPELLGLAQWRLGELMKQAFVPGGDPAMSGVDPAAAGMDPAATGGAPPAGAAPPAGGVDPVMLQQMVQQAVQQMGGAGGGAGGAAGGLKPKIDVNVEIMQIKNILAKISDALGVQIPAQDMVATPEKLMAMSQGQPTTSPSPGGGGGGSAISPIEPMPAASPDLAKQGYDAGVAFDTKGLERTTNKAAAIASLLQQRRG